uniref:Uncharacterized protein n=1 Tax=Physcomitrium patens TaxID=3218 RepID=A0A7I4EVP8_PHYPA
MLEQSPIFCWKSFVCGSFSCASRRQYKVLPFGVAQRTGGYGLAIFPHMFSKLVKCWKILKQVQSTF